MNYGSQRASQTLKFNNEHGERFIYITDKELDIKLNFIIHN